jgi:hypothetical protein
MFLYDPQDDCGTNGRLALFMKLLADGGGQYAGRNQYEAECDGHSCVKILLFMGISRASLPLR